MLQITIPAQEFFNERTGEFYTLNKNQMLSLEHSLLSVAKWESKWKKPFLDEKEKTREEFLDYIRCMTLTQNVSPIVYNGISTLQLNQIKAYMDDSMTATTFLGDQMRAKRRTSGQFITSELIYYWMTALNIPFECQKWHLNRLFVLIRVCSEENAPKKKMSRSDVVARNKALNAARRKKYNTKG